MAEEARYDKKLDVNGLTRREKEKLYQKLAMALSKSDGSGGPGIVSDILSFDRLYANIGEASQNCRKTYFIYIGLLSYALLTVLTTSDLHLILGQKVNLPVINTNVPVHFFFTLTPFLALGLFVYIQLYLIKIDKLIRFSLKKCHEEYGKNCRGEPKCKEGEEEKLDIHRICNLQKNNLYPWIIIFSRYYEKGLVGALQRMFVKFSLWWFLPVVLMTFNMFVIRKHESISSYYLLIMTLGGTSIVLAFWHYLDKSKYFGKIALCLIGLIFLYFVKDFIPTANEGILGAETYSQNEAVELRHYYLKYFSNWANVDLEHEILISEPKGVQKYEDVHLLNLESTHLEGANLASTILIRANLRNARLQHANLDRAVLNDADLDEANLSFAKLTEAKLKNASLYRAQLREADLVSAELYGANLSYSDLQDADLQGANLENADLQSANIRSADLRRVKGIKIEQIQTAMNWKLALYSEDFIDGLKLLQDHNNRIKKLNFKDFNLAGAKLQEADLRGANLHGTILLDANLQLADLRDIRGITKKQLLSAINCKLAIYSKDLLEILHLPTDHNDRLKKKNFNSYDLKSANLRGADFIDAILCEANLEKSDLSGANLKNADLSQANLKEANLKFTDLNEANLHKADLRKADLKGANLQRADLSGILFSNYDQFADVITLYQAKLDKNLMDQLENNYPFLFKKSVTNR